MSMQSGHHHHDYFAGDSDGSFWPAVLVIAAMFTLAGVAWFTA